MHLHLFDPLRALEDDLRCRVLLDPTGQVLLRFDRYHQPREIEKANSILQKYGKLLAVQLHAGRISVQKLLATGNIVLKSGRYVGLCDVQLIGAHQE